MPARSMSTALFALCATVLCLHTFPAAAADATDSANNGAASTTADSTTQSGNLATVVVTAQRLNLERSQIETLTGRHHHDYLCGRHRCHARWRQRPAGRGVAAGP